MEVIKSLENRRFLFKGTTTKHSSNVSNRCSDSKMIHGSGATALRNGRYGRYSENS